MNEMELAAGRQDSDAEATEFRVADFKDRLAGLEGVGETLGQAAIGRFRFLTRNRGALIQTVEVSRSTEDAYPGLRDPF